MAYPATGRHVGAAIIAGPHPLLGGHMHNNVVRSVGDGLAERGVLTVRFNYRGVGGSDGPTRNVAAHLGQFLATSHVPDEQDLWQDVQAAALFARAAAGSHVPLALIGYSFGCSLLARIDHERSAAALVLIAPTVSKHDHASYLDDTRRKLVIASEDDFATSSADLRQWFARLKAPKQLILQRFDNHFFRGHEVWLVSAIANYLENQWR